MENKVTEAKKTVQKRMEPKLKLINMDRVEVEQIEWLLYPFIPYGKVTIIQGDPGEGKTTMVLQIIAKLTRGEVILPTVSLTDDKENAEVPVNVIYQTAEDGLGDTIKPRLLAAGADCSKVLVIDDTDQPLTMADIRLEEAIIQTKARMVALDLLDDYDHQTMKRPDGNKAVYILSYEECRQVIDSMKFSTDSDLFGNEKDDSFKSSIGNIYQSFAGQDIYPTLEEKAANLLYFITKNHSFSDGNKRIAATMFLYFLDKNGILFADGNKLIDDHTLVALTIMIAESKPDEKEMMIIL